MDFGRWRNLGKVISCAGKSWWDQKKRKTRKETTQTNLRSISSCLWFCFCCFCYVLKFVLKCCITAIEIQISVKKQVPFCTSPSEVDISSGLSWPWRSAFFALGKFFWRPSFLLCVRYEVSKWKACNMAKGSPPPSTRDSSPLELFSGLTWMYREVTWHQDHVTKQCKTFIILETSGVVLQQGAIFPYWN